MQNSQWVTFVCLFAIAFAGIMLIMALQSLNLPGVIVLTVLMTVLGMCALTYLYFTDKPNVG